MRIRLLVFLIVATVAAARAESDLERKMDLAREAEDAHAEIELLRRWLDIHPNDPEAVAELVELWIEVPDYDMALQTLRQTANPDPGLVARTNADIAWYRDENTQETLKILRARAKEAPKERETRLALADYLAKAGERKEEIAVLDTLIAEESDFELLLDRAEAKLAADDPNGALADFRKAASDAPDETRVQNSRAIYERLEKAIAAVAALDKAAASPQVHFKKSYCWYFGGVPGRGLAEAVEGLRGWPDSAIGKILEARGLVAKGTLTSEKALEDRHVDVSATLDDEKARQGILQADAALAKKPGDPQVLVNRASWLNSSGQYALAMDDIQAVLKVLPSDINALHYAVAISLRQGNFPAAAAYTEKLKSLNAPREVLSDVYAGLAQCAFEQSKFPLALDYAARSLAAKPLPNVWKLKAACHTRLGQPNEAADALKQAEKGAR